MATRQQLREDFRTLEVLETLESLQDCPMSMELAGYNKTSFDLTGNYTGEPILRSELNTIARKHFQAMIKEQIAWVKKNITIPLQDKDKQ